MAVSVKKMVLWRVEVDNRPGVLGKVLAPLADAGADLQVVMGYRFPGNETKAAIELYPVSGRKMTRAAEGAGLSQSSMPALLVQGDNQPGLGRLIAEALAGADINVDFLVAQVIDEKFSAVVGFENEDDSRKASTLIKRAASGKGK